MDNTREFEITRIEDGVTRTVRDSVVAEFSLGLYLGGRHFVNLLCTPNDLDALVYGHLFSEGIIRRKEDLKSLSIRDDQAEVALAAEPSFEILPTALTLAYFSQAAEERWLPDEVFLPVEELLDAAGAFNAGSPLFASTGGVHSCALCHPSGKRIFMEDIGRHNAFDKAIGRALLEDWEIPQSFLLTSGRVPGYTVAKAVRAGLSVVVSRSAPTCQAVELARRSNMTLCGFARGRRINVYSAPQRILTGQGAIRAEVLQEEPISSA